MQNTQIRRPLVDAHVVTQGKLELSRKCEELGPIGQSWRPLISFYNHNGEVFWTRDTDPQKGYNADTHWTRLTFREQKPFQSKQAFVSQLGLDAASPKEVIVRVDYDGTHYFVVKPKQVVHILDPNKGELVFFKRYCPLPWQFFGPERQIRR